MSIMNLNESVLVPERIDLSYVGHRFDELGEDCPRGLQRSLKRTLRGLPRLINQAHECYLAPHPRLEL